jgi:hypothetical protein
MLDVVREVRPRFVPAQVIADFAQLLKLYKITEIQGDKYAIGFHEAEWRTHGIKFTACKRTTSENYLQALPLLLAGRVRLVDNLTLRNQLSSLERRAGAGDRETVAHAQHASARDDLACAACGALVLAASQLSFLERWGAALADEPLARPQKSEAQRMVREDAKPVESYYKRLERESWERYQHDQRRQLYELIERGSKR